MNVFKTDNVLRSVFFLFVSLILYISAVGAAVFAEASLWVLLGFLFFVAFLFEIGVFLTQRALAIRYDIEAKRSLTRLLPRLRQYFGVAAMVLGMVLVAVVGGVVVYLLSGMDLESVQMTVSGYVGVGFVAGHLLLRKPLISGFSALYGSFKEWRRASLPSYELYSNGVKIDPKISGVADFAVWFKDLDVVESVSYYEAVEYMDRVGVDVEQGMDQVKSLMNMRDEQPSTYFFVDSSGETLILHGESLHYVITVGTTDASDVVRAFERFQSEHS
jgi:hypothetical protein